LYPDLKSKVAIITAAGRGIGRAIAEEFVKSSVSVAVNSLTEKSLETLVAHLEHIKPSSKILSLLGDASDPQFVKQSVQKVVDTFGSVDVLVNNLGIGIPKPTIELEVEEWDKILAVNLRSTFLWSKYVAAHLLASKKQGSIINISSHLGVIGRKQRAAYCASKAGIIGLTRALAAEWAGSGISVNCVAPGTTLTDRVSNIMKLGYSAEDSYKSRIPLGKLASPSEVAKVVVFLASGQASYIQGSTIIVDGGAIAGAGNL
jgi:2-deoxy-D-gluconate 3-dehydrogenase